MGFFKALPNWEIGIYVNPDGTAKKLKLWEDSLFNLFMAMTIKKERKTIQANLSHVSLRRNEPKWRELNKKESFLTSLITPPSIGIHNLAYDI